MTTFHIIVGLPGSGKTHLATSMYEKMSIVQEKNVLLLDDLGLNFKAGTRLFHEGEGFTDVIIADPLLVGVSEEQIKRTIREHFTSDASFIFTYFENAPEFCIENAKRVPKEGGTIGFIVMMTKWYTIPEGATTIPVYRQNA